METLQTDVGRYGCMDGWVCLWMDGLMDASICSCIEFSMHVYLYACDYVYGISCFLLPSGGKRQAKFGEGGGRRSGGWTEGDRGPRVHRHTASDTYIIACLCTMIQQN